jgi:hypothetical protein
MPPETGPVSQPSDGPWLERWLSVPRLGRYLAATNGDRTRALLLYDWNARISGRPARDQADVSTTSGSSPHGPPLSDGPGTELSLA